jgi:hypothetical protein
VSYTGYATGTVTLTTGLRSVTVSVRFSKKSADANLGIDESCVPPPVKYLPCSISDAGWNITSVSGYDNLGEEETPGYSFPWEELFFWGGTGVRTPSKWLTWTGDMDVAGGSAPRLNTAARTVTVALTGSSAITGGAVISYTSIERTPIPCYVGSKPYTETTTFYFGGAKATRPLQAHTVLDGTVTLNPIRDADYSSVSLKAKKKAL